MATYTRFPSVSDRKTCAYPHAEAAIRPSQRRTLSNRQPLPNLLVDLDDPGHGQGYGQAEWNRLVDGRPLIRIALNDQRDRHSALTAGALLPPSSA